MPSLQSPRRLRALTDRPSWLQAWRALLDSRKPLPVWEELALHVAALAGWIWLLDTLAA
jgi:hypothetical protein